MMIKLYSNSTETNWINKDLVEIAEFDCEPFLPCTIENPEFTLTGIDLSVLTKANYMYVPDYNRYYFITNRTLAPGGIMVISGRVDVVTSFRDDILRTKAYIDRNEYLFNPYLEDNRLQVRDTKVISVENWGQVGDDNFSFYVTCVGGGSDE